MADEVITTASDDDIVEVNTPTIDDLSFANGTRIVAEPFNVMVSAIKENKKEISSIEADIKALPTIPIMNYESQNVKKIEGAEKTIQFLFKTPFSTTPVVMLNSSNSDIAIKNYSFIQEKDEPITGINVDLKNNTNPLSSADSIISFFAIGSSVGEADEDKKIEEDSMNSEKEA